MISLRLFGSESVPAWVEDWQDLGVLDPAAASIYGGR